MEKASKGQVLTELVEQANSMVQTLPPEVRRRAFQIVLDMLIRHKFGIRPPKSFPEIEGIEFDPQGVARLATSS